MADYLNISDFARLAGCSRQTIYTGIKDGTVRKTAKGIDPSHPDNAYFIENMSQSLRAGSRNGKKSREKPRQTPSRGEAGEKKSPLPAQGPGGVQAQGKGEAPPPDISPEDIGRLDFSQLEFIDTINNLNQAGANKIKIVEQIRELQLKREQKRLELIPRGLVRKFLSRLFLIDRNEFLTFAEKLAPEIAAICGVTSQEKVLEIGKLIEKESYKTLEHKKRSIEEFLKELRTEMENEKQSSLNT